jgi:hypothetical protein
MSDKYDWEVILDELPVCDWPIHSAIEVELFDEEDMKILKQLMVKALNKMNQKQQKEYYESIS